MHEFIELLKQFDFFTVLSLGVIVWYFTNETKKSLGNKIDDLDKDIRIMSTRVSRLEGTVYGTDIYKKLNETNDV